MFGEKLKELRKSAKMTQAELANRLGLERSSIGKYETGGVMPSDEIKMAIASLFGVSLDYLMGYDAGIREKQTNEPSPADPASGRPASGLTDEDLEKIARIVQSSANAEVPRTDEGRIVSFGMDNVPKETRQYLLSVVRAVMAKTPYEKYFADKGESDT